MQKREKRRWLFRKPTPLPENAAQPAKMNEAVAVAVATAAAEAAMEVARLSKPAPEPEPEPAYNSREHYAATIIQTAFRGYLVSV